MKIVSEYYHAKNENIVSKMDNIYIHIIFFYYFKLDVYHNDRIYVYIILKQANKIFRNLIYEI